jgi:hypothetical protein
MGLLDGGIKTIIGNALPFLFLDFVLVRSTTTQPTNPWENPTVTESEYPCKAIITKFKYHEIDGEKIKAEDHKILFLADSVSIEPAIDDRVYRVGETNRYLIVSPVRKDPAGATFTAQAR